MVTGQRDEVGNARVTLRSTLARSCFKNSICWFIVLPKGPLSSPLVPPSSSGPTRPLPKSVSVLKTTMCAIPYSVGAEGQKQAARITTTRWSGEAAAGSKPVERHTKREPERWLGQASSASLTEIDISLVLVRLFGIGRGTASTISTRENIVSRKRRI